MPLIDSITFPDGTLFLREGYADDPIPIFTATFPDGGDTFVWNPDSGMTKVPSPDETDGSVSRSDEEEFRKDAEMRSARGQP